MSDVMDGARRHPADDSDMAGRARRVVVPSGANAFAIAADDIAEAVRLAPVWLHDGWINVVWRFRRTRLGPLWHTLGLAGFIVTMGIVWSVVLKIDFYNYFRYVSVNLIAWSFIASFVLDGTGAFVNGQSTALSMRFPYVAFSLAQVWRALLLLAHHAVLYVVMVAVTLHPPGPNGLLVFPALILLTLNGVWISVLVAILCLRWRDMMPAFVTGMQVLLLVTPVFWPKSFLGQEMAFAADYNPLYHFLTIFREPLLGNLAPLSSWYWVGGTLIAGSLTTFWVYGRVRNRLAYWY